MGAGALSGTRGHGDQEQQRSPLHPGAAWTRRQGDTVTRGLQNCRGARCARAQGAGVTAVSKFELRIFTSDVPRLASNFEFQMRIHQTGAVPGLFVAVVR